jgi:hypothetical protein
MEKILTIMNINSNGKAKTTSPLYLRPKSEGLVLVTSIRQEEKEQKGIAGIVDRLYNAQRGRRVEIFSTSSGYFLKNMIGDDEVIFNGNPMSYGKVAKIRSKSKIVMLDGRKMAEVLLRIDQQRKYALLVAGHADKIGATYNDVTYIANELRKRTFHVDVLSNPGQVSRENVVNELRYIGEEMTRGNDFWFSYHGRGAKKGISIYDQVLTSNQFYTLLRRIRGNKAVFLDCCFSGVFLSEVNLKRIPKNTAVLSSCSSTSHANERVIKNRGFMGEFSAALVDYLEYFEDSVKLSYFHQSMHWPAYHVTKRLISQGPDFGGSDFVLPARIEKKVI